MQAAACMSAVPPPESGALGSQPSRSSASTTSVWPLAAAAATAGSPDPRWWSGKPSDGLTDEAVDWIEARANNENPDT